MQSTASQILKADSKDRLRRKLLARIHRRYDTITEQIELGDVAIMFTRIANPNRVLDQACEEEDRREHETGERLADPPHLPYWAELWESSRTLAALLPKLEPKANLVNGDRVAQVLDLGCGMGLAGAAAAALGYQVTLADLESPALLFARLNTLDYSATVRRLNWQTDNLAQTFDLILGADILYDRTQWHFLEPFWRSHLTPGGSILLTEPSRPTGDLFIPWIREKGWFLRQSITESAPRIRAFRLTC